MNKKISIVVAALFLMSACSWFSSSPSSVVKKLLSAAESGDVDTMVSLWGSGAVKEEGTDKIRSNAQGFAQTVRGIKASGQTPRPENMRETIQGDQARVFFIYRASPENSVGMGFALLKENGSWKLYRSIDIWEEDRPFDSSFRPRKETKPEPEATPMEMVSPPPPPPANTNSSRKSGSNSNSNSNTSAPAANTTPISGGVLNSKAVSLPKPVYPSIAKATKASGTVVVSVTVDENGRVINAHATSGHPLLRAAAEAAAHNARFNPTMLSGKPVKVVGAITYQFSPE